MKMGRLIAAAVVLAALAGVLYWSGHHTPSVDTAAVAAKTPPTIVSLQQDDISKLEIKKKDGDDVVLDRVGGEDWKITAPKPYLADRDPVSAILYSFSPLSASDVIAEKAGDLKAYGLDAPAVEVTATTKDGKTQKVLIGDNTPTGDAAYAMLAGDSKVFAISTTTKGNFDKGLKDLRDKSLLPADLDKASAVELSGPKLNLSMSHDNGQWVVRSPKDFRADPSELDDVVKQIRAATIDAGASEDDMKKAASMFSSGTPVATVKVTDASGSQAGPQELQIRKNKDTYYAKASAMDGVYKVSDDLGKAVDKTTEEFRDKNLFDFGAEVPQKIEMQDGSKTYTLSRSGEDWMSDGKKMDPESVDALVRAIRLLKADKLGASGFSNPTISVTVTSNDGKRIEKVQIAKAGSGYVAKREDNPTLYALTAQLTEDLHKSAEELKPAELAPAKK